MIKILRITLLAGLLAAMAPASAGLLIADGMVTGGEAAMVTSASGLTSAEFTFFPTPTAWDPGANTARNGGHPAPGGATFSIMGAGFVDVSGADVQNDGVTLAHPGPTSAITALGVTFSTPGVSSYADLVNWALDTWAAVSGFTNLGQVADGGVNAGASEASGGALGDIRVAAWEIAASTTLAHAFQPGNESIFGAGGSIAGDLHMDVARTWVDNAADVIGNGVFDIFTVMLHEIGHSLGLGHSGVLGAVMEPIYAGSRRSLSADDIAGIQALYGPPSVVVTPVPEPGTLWLLGLGLLGLGWSHRRNVAA